MRENKTNILGLAWDKPTNIRKLLNMPGVHIKMEYQNKGIGWKLKNKNKLRIGEPITTQIP